MTRRTQTLTKNRLNSYSFNKTLVPFPKPVSDRLKPPLLDGEACNSIKPDKQPSLDEQAQAYMDTYRKAERIIIINFYTGGGAYRRGVLDAIYRGFNPLNP